MARMYRTRWLTVAGVLTVVLALGVAAFFALRPTTTQPTTRTSVITVATSTENVTVSLTGTLSAARQANLSFGAAGTVQTVPVVVGQRVDEGTILATIDDTTLRDALTLARAQLTAAEASYTQTRNTKGASAAQVASARAQVNSASAKVTSAQNNLASARLTAPFGGLVAAVNVAVGESASGAAATSGLGAAAGTAGLTTTAGQAAVVVIDPTAWIVNGSVGTADVGALKAGQKVVAVVEGTTVSVPGTISTVGIVASASSGATAFPVTIALEGNPAGLYYGASVNVTVTAGEYRDILTIPTAALTTQGTTTNVAKVVDGAVVLTPVTTGAVFGDRTQVLTGLVAGDQIQVTTRVAPGSPRSPGMGFPGSGGGQGRQGPQPPADQAPPAGTRP